MGGFAKDWHRKRSVGTIRRQRDEASHLDEEVGDGQDYGQDQRRKDLGEDDDPPRNTGRVGRELLRRVAHLLLLVPGDPGPREATVADPRVGVGARVAARHPAEVLAVVDDEVAEGKLVRVEEERRDAERNDGDPKVGHYQRLSATRRGSEEEWSRTYSTRSTM